MLGHTRWASVGHHLRAQRPPGVQARSRTARARARTSPPPSTATSTTTPTCGPREGLAVARRDHHRRQGDPALVARRLAEGDDLDEAFRRTVATFEGSVAIARHQRRGSGAAATWPCGAAVRRSTSGWPRTPSSWPASPTGWSRRPSTYLRMDGETPANPDNPTASRGQVVVLDGGPGGHGRGHRSAGLRRHGAARGPEPTSQRPRSPRATSTGATSRTSCSRRSPRRPASFRKTLRGKVDRAATAGRRGARAARHCPTSCGPACATGGIHRVLVIGQGTAAVAGQSLAATLEALTRRQPPCGSRPSLATELSGFGLADDMSDTLVVAISQSGTTTDTNRTVDLVRARGAAVVAIVNRRDSDLTDKADGVLYTSDGRDVEMSVASTKAFYAQVAAGFLLAVGHGRRARRRGHGPSGRSCWPRCATCPTAMEQVLGPASRIGETAQQLAPARRYWAVVGNGPNRIAAARGADQAVGALLQVDRLRRHRGQEAHRPVLRAAHPGVRRRA